MIRTALIAFAAIAATVVATEATAQGSAPVRKLAVTAEGQWAVVRSGDRTVSHCMMGVRSDAVAPLPGKPQFMISADGEFAILRVRAAEWSFTGGRDIAVTLVTEQGSESTPSAAVHGSDLIDIAVGRPERIADWASSTHIEIRAEGQTVRLPLGGLSEVLPAYRACVSSVGQPVQPQMHASALR